MKTTQFKQLIKEAVREVVREELAPVKKALIESLKPRLNKNQMLGENRAEKIIFGAKPHVTRTNSQNPRPVPQKSLNPVLDILAETASGMTAADYNNMISGNGGGGGMGMGMSMEGFDPTSLAAELGYTDDSSFMPDIPQPMNVQAPKVQHQGPPQNVQFLGNSPQIAKSINEMIQHSSPGGVVKEPEQVGEITAVPDFRNFMSVLKSKGKI
jgi:hypothetical protein